MPDQPGSGPSRYIRIARVEKLDNYRPGGFHPIRLGDTFKDGRYVVVNKLGYGGASTVWLAHDTYQQQAVALSIIMSEGPTGTVERQLDTLRHLSTGPEGHPGHDNVLPLLDEFTITGPNGTHTCFSTTIMGQSISVATKRAQGVATKVLRLNVAKEAVINLANAISYLTLMGVVHGDLHPGNLLLSLSGANMYSLEDIKQRTGPPRTVPIACVDGGPLPSNIPTQAIEAAFEGDIDPSAFSGPMKISDFGDAFFASDPPHMTSKLGPYIVPEYASPAKMSPKIDVWLLGCATYQIISGHDLFGIPDDSPELVTRRMMETLGRPPDFLVRDWEAQIGHSIEVLDKPVENKSLRSRVMDIRDGNTERGMKARENEFSAGDVQTLTELLESLLKFDPDDRPDIEQVLKHAAMDYFRLQTLEDSLN